MEGDPSANSTPALTHRWAETRTKMPAWSNWAEKAAVNSTSMALSPGNGASRACSLSWTKP